MSTTVADLVIGVSAKGVEATKAGLGQVSGLLGNFPALGVLAGAGLTAGLAAGGVAAVKMAGDFQAGMTSLVTGAGESEKNIDMVSKSILQMAVDTGTSTSQLTAGMYMIESAGFHGKAGLDVLKAAAEGAKVGNADLGTVADATTTILKDYPGTMNGAAGAVNALTATVASGKTHMQDLAGSLAAVAPTASAAGVSLYDMLGAMATMTGEGVPAANAATYLRQTIIALEAPSSAGAKALKAIGLSAQDVQDSIKGQGLPATLDMITTKVGKEFPVGSAAYIEAIKAISGGSKSMQGILDLTGAHMKDFSDNTNAVGGAAVASGQKIQGWANVQSDFNFKIDKAKEVVETLMISLGTKLLPVAGRLADFFTGSFLPAVAGVANVFMDHILPIVGNVAIILSGRLQPAVAAVEHAFGGLGKGLGAINWEVLGLQIGNIAANVGIVLSNAIIAAVAVATTLGNVIGWVKQHFDIIGPVLVGVAAVILTGMVPSMIAAGTAAVASFGAAAAAAWAFTVALLANPMTWIAIAIGAAVALIILAITHWGAITTWLGNLWGDVFNAVKATIQNASSFISGVLLNIALWFDGLESRIRAFLLNVVLWFGELPDRIRQAGIDMIQGFIDGIGSMVGNLEGAFASLIHNMVSALPGGAALAHLAGIPGFASGVSNFAGGLAMVGEQGPELAFLPSGTSVLPAQQTAAAMGGGGRSGPVIINVHVAGHKVAQVLLPDLVKSLSIASGDRSH